MVTTTRPLSGTWRIYGSKKNSLLGTPVVPDCTRDKAGTSIAGRGTGEVMYLVENNAGEPGDAEVVERGERELPLGVCGGAREPRLACYWSPAERLKRKSRITNPPKKKAAMMTRNPTTPSKR